MKREDCEIVDTWYTLGMKATDSNDVAASEVFVPASRTFPLIPEFKAGPHFKGLLYQFPAIGLCVACLIAPVALAVARNAIEELKMLADKKTPLGSMVPIKERGVVQRKLGEAEALVQSSRAYLYQVIAESWSKTLAGEKISLKEKAGLQLAAAHTNQSCFKAVDLMYSAAGSTAIYNRNKLEHYFTDAQVIRQHGFVNESRYETVAQIYLGLQPDLPVIGF
jgi:alkylation response protein AidB-like acyl-CoA dehydrogenase